MNAKKTLKTACRLAAMLSLGLGSAHAQTTITNADGAALNATTSWLGGVVPGPANIAVWDHTVQVNSSFTLGSNTAWAGIQIFDPALPIMINAGNSLTNGASGIDLSRATNALTLSCPVVLGASQTWNVTNGLMLNAGGIVSGSSLLTLNNGGNNTGSIVLSGANTYSGGTVINSGIAQINTINAFGTGAVTNIGGLLECVDFPHSGIMVNAFYITGTTFLDMANISASFVFDGAWSGSGTLLVTNDTASGSTLTLGGASGGNMANFTGSIIVVTNASGTPSAGTLRFNNGGSAVNTGNAAMTINLGTNSAVHLANRDGGTTSVGTLLGGPGTIVLGPSGAAGTETWSIGGNNSSSTFAGSFSNNAANEIAALTKVGAGTLTLTGTNTSATGLVTISAGTLQIGDGNADGTLLASAVANNGSLVFNRPDSYTVTNNISGGGTLTIQDGGTNTYDGLNTSSGTTIVSQGDLVLGSSGTMSCPISVGSAGTFDISQNPTFMLNQNLSGFGVVTGLVTAVGGSINPGASGAAGTLTFASGLTETGTVNNQLALSSPGSTNDLISVLGNLTLSGVNNLSLSHLGGGTIPNGTYPLIAYTGVFSGSLTNLTVTAIGVAGTLTNITSTTPPEIAVVVSPSVRGPTNLTWIGGGANTWDTSSTNWINGATQFTFQTGDSVLFSDVGDPNTNVDLLVTLLPASVVVSNAAEPYTFSGVGEISGSTGLVKTNSGTLTILTTNAYTGQTIVGQGVLEVLNVTISGSPSAIGAANNDPSNLVFYGSTFKYSGATSNTDHGMTLNAAGVTIDVTNATTDLTLNGLLAGPGALTQTGLGTLTLGNPNTYAGGTFLSNGVLALGGNNANNNGTGSGVGATNNPVTFNGGILQLYGYGQSTANNYNTFYNPLVVPAGQTGTLLMFPRGAVNTGGGAGLNSSLLGGGTLNLVVNYVRDSLSGNWSAFTGLINVTSKNGTGDEMRLNNSFGYSNAAIYLNGAVTMDSTLTANATINIGELGGISSAIIGPGNESEPGPTWCVGWKNTTNTFAGVIEDDSTAPGGHTSITKVGSGTWFLGGNNTFTGLTTISNGVLALTNVGNGDGAFDASTNIFVNADSFLDASGTSSSTLYLYSGQVLSGNGTVTGILDTTPGGTVSPGGGVGGSVGVLTVTNDINLGGTAWMKLNRTNSPESDLLISSFSYINYGGTLEVVNTGPALAPGDTFTLFSGSAYNGGFGSIIFQNYTMWDTSKLSVNGTVKYIGASAPPSFSTVDFSDLANGAITFNATNGAPNGLVVILSTTNLALPHSNWTPVATNNFDGNGNLNNLAVAVDPTQPQEFYILQAY